MPSLWLIDCVGVEWHVNLCGSFCHLPEKGRKEIVAEMKEEKGRKRNRNESEETEETRGPWWSYIAHLTKQICIFTVEISAKFTALGFLYKLYSTNHPHPSLPHPRPCFFTNLDNLNWILKEGHQRNISAKLYWNWSSCLKSFI